jgi:hypothetical protein
MKAIDRRLRRLQESFALEENEQGESLAELIRERRRHRVEASGEPSESGPCESLTDDQNRPLSVADVLRMGRRRVESAGTRTRLSYRYHVLTPLTASIASAIDGRTA